ncbi:hypothetical protein S40288_11071 [Stachybotrys chartarum IBT 40288]|nr:hypothetical protein S40288_11071 [Stachybotrys chartarum IBT 40288]
MMSAHRYAPDDVGVRRDDGRLWSFNHWVPELMGSAMWGANHGPFVTELDLRTARTGGLPDQHADTAAWARITSKDRNQQPVTKANGGEGARPKGSSLSRLAKAAQQPLHARIGWWWFSMTFRPHVLHGGTKWRCWEAAGPMCGAEHKPSRSWSAGRMHAANDDSTGKWVTVRAQPGPSPCDERSARQLQCCNKVRQSAVGGRQPWYMLRTRRCFPTAESGSHCLLPPPVRAASLSHGRVARCAIGLPACWKAQEVVRIVHTTDGWMDGWMEGGRICISHVHSELSGASGCPLFCVMGVARRPWISYGTVPQPYRRGKPNGWQVAPMYRLQRVESHPIGSRQPTFAVALCPVEAVGNYQGKKASPSPILPGPLSSAIHLRLIFSRGRPPSLSSQHPLQPLRAPTLLPIRSRWFHRALSATTGTSRFPAPDPRRRFVATLRTFTPIHPPDFAPNPSNGALRFDGTDSYLDVVPRFVFLFSLWSATTTPLVRSCPLVFPLLPDSPASFASLSFLPSTFGSQGRAGEDSFCTEIASAP